MLKKCRILNKLTNANYYGELDIQLDNPYLVEINDDRNFYIWDWMNDKPIIKHVYLKDVYDEITNILNKNYKNSLIEERQIGDYWFTLEDNFRVMIKADIDSATQFGVTQISGMKDLKGNIIRCTIDDALIIYKQLWIENKLLYIKYQSIEEEINAILNDSSLLDEDKIVQLNKLSLDVKLDADQVQRVLLMNTEELNQFIMSLT